MRGIRGGKKPSSPHQSPWDTSHFIIIPLCPRAFRLPGHVPLFRLEEAGAKAETLSWSHTCGFESWLSSESLCKSVRPFCSMDLSFSFLHLSNGLFVPPLVLKMVQR